MTKRLKILSPADIIQYYEAPVFTSDEYAYYFKLDIHEEGILQEVGFVSSKAYFILLLGYFKAKQQLFKLWEIKNISSCLEFVQVKYFPHHHRLIDLHICRPTRLAIEYRVLQLFGYQVGTAETMGRLNDFANSIVTIDSSPIFMFKELYIFFRNIGLSCPDIRDYRN